MPLPLSWIANWKSPLSIVQRIEQREAPLCLMMLLTHCKPGQLLNS